MSGDTPCGALWHLSGGGLPDRAAGDEEFALGDTLRVVEPQQPGLQRPLAVRGSMRPPTSWK